MWIIAMLIGSLVNNTFRYVLLMSHKFKDVELEN